MGLTTSRFAAAWVVTMAGVVSSLHAQRVPLLPDIQVREADLRDHDVRTIGEARFLRLSNGTMNVGEGELRLLGAPPANEDGTLTVLQRISYNEGPPTDRIAGFFVFHEIHDHIHIEDWSRYRLRELLPDNSVGGVIAESEKVSFCIFDLQTHDPSLPNAPQTRVFTSCDAEEQGLSVGWIDIYTKNLAGQRIDITDVPDGVYWLESVVDPFDHILELNEDNNVARVKVLIGLADGPDAFEPNDLLSAVRNGRAGGPNSANLGPCDPFREVAASIHADDPSDLFRFYLNSDGGTNTFARLAFNNSQGLLDLILRADDGTELKRSAVDGSEQKVDFSGLSEGWYFAQVMGRDDDAQNPSYTLTIVPPKNSPPQVTVLTPPEGNVDLIHGINTYAVTWEHTDPENNSSWVSVYVDPDPAQDGDEQLLSLSRFTPADTGSAIINSAEVEPGTYYIVCEITDGGITTRTWSEGTVTFHEFKGDCRVLGSDSDCNGNSIKDSCEIEADLLPDCNQNGLPDGCEFPSGTVPDSNSNGIPDSCEKPIFRRGDSNHDGGIDIADATHILGFLFLGSPVTTCAEAANVNNDRELDISDALGVLHFLFFGTAPAGPDLAGGPLACRPDPDPIGGALDLGCEIYDRCR